MTRTEPADAAPRDADPSEFAVAITGMAGRFPGAADLDRFWANIRDGVESITFFDDETLTAAGFGRDLLDDPEFVPAKGYLADADLFDHEFFGIAPRDAELTDPQQRLFLQTAWAALEDAGIPPGPQLSVAVFVGANNTGYGEYAAPWPRAQFQDMQFSIGNDLSYLSTRVSHKLGLTGPSLTVGTACSSALTAVHLACSALLAGECDVAIAGATAVHFPLITGYRHTPESILAPDGHCRPFDRHAAGTVGGDGVGAVVLRRLEDAVADGDPVHAVIRGSAVNNDGSDKVGFTAPSVGGQAGVLRAALAAADCAPESVDYVEAHGTGTSLGDPVEIAALRQVYGSAPRTSPLSLGSVKANIGHLSAAAGIAALIKTALALRHAELPPLVHFTGPNPELDAPPGMFDFPVRARPWPGRDGPRRAGVSSFGIGGTNVHLVLEEYRSAGRACRPSGSGPQVLPLSANSPEALADRVEALARWADAHPDADPAEVAHTLQTGRTAFAHRWATVGEDLSGLRTRPQEGSVREPAGEPSVCFVFPGFGTQRRGAVAALLEREPTFAAEVDRLAGVAGGLGIDLRAALDGSAGSATRDPGTAHAALFAEEYALAAVWRHWGVQPTAMAANSLGEYAAAAAAGVMTPGDALRLLTVRARLAERLCPEGAMLAVATGPAELAARLGPGLSLAVIAAPDRCVVSGTVDRIEALHAVLDGEGVSTRRVAADRAFHSEALRPMCAEYTAEVARCELRPPTIPFVSCATGSWITGEQATDPEYWAVDHLLGTVRLADAISLLRLLPRPTLLGVGPYENLAAAASRPGESGPGPLVVTSLAAAAAGEAADLSMARALAAVWTAGAEVDWPAVHRHEPRGKVHLPSYPFARVRHWPAHLAGAPSPVATPLLSPAPAPTAAPDGAGGPADFAAAVFRDVLGLPSVAADVSFFHLGGDSLSMAQVLARVRRAYAVRVPVREFVARPTPQGLAALIESRTAADRT
ncbi:MULTISPECIES: type I polyketide synthase [unclassified Streptomyces]|uniref:type I polyketide synthase n=1 Tax=unclassified Streptomyces TaxID=2593676 RepID=UPI002E282326|nr:type I polyketide synthase [Streptomyces sp. NBC_00223]